MNKHHLVDGKMNEKIVLIRLIALMVISVGFLSGCVEIPDEIVEEMVIVTFTVDPSLIDAGETANLSWVVTGMDTTVTIDNGIGNVSLTGQQIITPIETTTYTLTASNMTSTKIATTQIIVRDETQVAPTMTFIKEDTAQRESLTVVSASPVNLYWSDFTILVDGNDAQHTLTGTVEAGNVIYFEPANSVGISIPTTDYTVAIRHDPTNTLIYETSFVGNPPVIPTISFIKEDTTSTNTLTVVSASPADVDWSDLGLQVDGTVADHGMSGIVLAGDIIDITSIAGTGAYTITIRYIPTNTLIGEFDFAG